MTTFNGLPAHILLVHAVVVLVPLTALLLLLVAFWPAARRRLTVLTAALALVTLISVPLTTKAGGWLAHRVAMTPLLRAHTHLGHTLLPWVGALFVVAAGVGVRQFITERRARRDLDVSAETMVAAPRGESVPGGMAATMVIAVLALIVSVGSVVQVYRIGDSGARAAWTGNFSEQPLSTGHSGAPRNDG